MEKNIFIKTLEYVLLSIANLMLVSLIVIFALNGEYDYVIITSFVAVAIDFLSLTFIFRRHKQRNILWAGLLVIGTVLFTLVGSHLLISLIDKTSNYLILDVASLFIGILLIVFGEIFFYKKDKPIEESKIKEEVKPAKEVESEKTKIEAKSKSTINYESDEQVISFKREMNGGKLSESEEKNTKNKFKVKKISNLEDIQINNVEVDNLKEKLVSIIEYIDLLKSRKEKFIKDNKYDIPFLDNSIEYGEFLMKQTSITIKQFLNGEKFVLEDYERLILRPNSGYDLEYMIKKIKREPKLAKQIKLEAKNFNFYSLVFNNTDFSEVNFDDTFIINATFDNCSFERSKFKNSIIKNGIIKNSKINDSSINGLTLISTNISNLEADNVNLEDVWFSDSKLEKISANDNKISNSKIIRTNINEINLEGSKLEDIHFEASSLSNINFNKSEFNNINVQKGNFNKIVLTNTKLNEVSLNKVNEFEELIFSSSFIEENIYKNIKIDQNHDAFVKNIYIEKNKERNKLGDLVQYQLLKTYKAK